MINTDLYTKSAMTPEQLQARLSQRAVCVPAKKNKFRKADRKSWKRGI